MTGGAAQPARAEAPDPSPAGALVEAVRAYNPAADLDAVRRAYDFAADKHSGQFRRSGEPYVVHPAAVARIIAELRLDVASVCAGLLHDCVEDTSATADDIRAAFGPEVQMLVDGVTKLGRIAWNTREEKQAENFRKMLIAMARDIRVILVKLADRTDNMRTLQHLPRDKQERIARETRDIYAPMANRLGIQWMKVELDDLAFKYLETPAYDKLVARIAETETSRAAYIAEVSATLGDTMREAGIPAEVGGRAKHLWSLHQKMARTGRDLDQIHDAIAFRVLTDNVRDCYAALGVVHSHWTPVPGRFKDFIALPKPNLYQSLHTTVIGPRSDRMEVQIRTRPMHEVAEHGVAAHWQYKDGKAMAPADHKAFAWLHQLMEWQRDLKDPAEFLDSVKIDLFEEEVFVFTPKGDVQSLPKGATPVDFAYAIHSQVGDRCSGARVNGVIVPLRYKLRNGDTVDILTSPSQRPSRDWLKFVATSRAKTRIRQFGRGEQRERGARLGREILAKSLRARGVSLEKVERDGRLDKVAADMKCAAEDLLVGVGWGRYAAEQVAESIAPRGGDEGGAAAEPAPLPASEPRRQARRSVGGIRVQGEADIVVRFAKCCSPVPGDPIVAFVSPGRGVSVHTHGCAKTLDLHPDRRVDVSWDDGVQMARPVTVEVQSVDRPGVLAAISKCFTEQGVNIAQARCRTIDGQGGINTFQVMIGHLDQLEKVLRAIRMVDGVTAVARL